MGRLFSEHVQVGVDKRDLELGEELGKKILGPSKSSLLFPSFPSYFSLSSLLTTIKI